MLPTVFILLAIRTITSVNQQTMRPAMGGVIKGEKHHGSPSEGTVDTLHNIQQTIAQADLPRGEKKAISEYGEYHPLNIIMAKPHVKHLD